MAIDPTAPTHLAAALAERVAGEVIAPDHRGYETARRLPGLLEDGDAAAVRSRHGSSHARLARIKAAYDPENRFRLNQNVHPAA